MKFRSDINGLRAIAVLGVVLFHFKSSYLPGGFTGVDVFFVISGYLMTSIIMNGIENKSFTLFNFYFARARRIVPALTFLCTILLIIGWFYSTPEDFRALGKHITSSLSFLSNFVYFSESGYFNSASHEKWLLHTWSLSVEWQFYMLYPILIILFVKILPQNLIKKGILAVCVFSFLFSVYASYHWPNSAFYLLPSRAWEMILGGLVFLFPLQKQISIKFSRYMHKIGLLIIFLSYFLLTEENTWPGLLALFPVGGAFLILLAQRSSSILSSSTTLQFIGNSSYSIYLWHWPIVAFLNNIGKTNDNTYIAIGIILSIVLGWLSYTFIENKIKSFPTKLINFSLVGLLSILGVMAVSVYIFDGYKSRVSEDYLTRIKYQVMPTRNNSYCFYHFNEGKKLSIGLDGTNCLLGSKKSPPTGLLFGDSFAGHFEPFWDEILKSKDVTIRSITTNWCFPSITESFTGPNNHQSFQQCKINRKYIEENILDYQFIIIAGKWDDVLKNGYINETIDFIDFAKSKGLMVYIMPSPTAYDTDILKRFHTSLFNGFEFTPQNFSKQKDTIVIKANLKLKNYALNHSEVQYIDRDSLFGKNDFYIKNGIKTPYSLDGMHISLEGSKQVSINFKQSAYYKNVFISLKNMTNNSE
jgi:peptidoglycan/LPS O-acetylase OafA/YrhL